MKTFRHTTNIQKNILLQNEIEGKDNSNQNKLTVGNYIIRDSIRHSNKPKSIPKIKEKMLGLDSDIYDNINTNEKERGSVVVSRENLFKNILVNSQEYKTIKYQTKNENFQNKTLIINSQRNKNENINTKSLRHFKYPSFTNLITNENITIFRKVSNLTNKTGFDKNIFNKKDNIKEDYISSLGNGPKNLKTFNSLKNSLYLQKNIKNRDYILSTSHNLDLNNNKNSINIKELYNKDTKDQNKSYISQKIDYENKYKNFINRVNKAKGSFGKENNQNIINIKIDNIRTKKKDKNHNNKNIRIDLSDNLINLNNIESKKKNSIYNNYQNNSQTTLNSNIKKDISKIKVNKNFFEKPKNFIDKKQKTYIGKNELKNKYHEENYAKINKIPKNLLIESNRTNSEKYLINFGSFKGKINDDKIQDKEKKKQKKNKIEILECKDIINDILLKDKQLNNNSLSPAIFKNIIKNEINNQKSKLESRSSINILKNINKYSTNIINNNFITEKHYLINKKDNKCRVSTKENSQNCRQLTPISIPKKISISPIYSNKKKNPISPEIYTNSRKVFKIQNSKEMSDNDQGDRPKSEIRRKKKVKDISFSDLFGSFNGKESIQEIEVNFNNSLSNSQKKEKYSLNTPNNDFINVEEYIINNNFNSLDNLDLEIKSIENKKERKNIENKKGIRQLPNLKIKQYFVRIKNPEKRSKYETITNYNIHPRKSMSDDFEKVITYEERSNYINNSKIYFKQKPQIWSSKNKNNSNLNTYYSNSNNIPNKRKNIYQMPAHLSKNKNVNIPIITSVYHDNLNVRDTYVFNNINFPEEENILQQSIESIEMIKSPINKKSNKNKKELQLLNETFSFKKENSSKIYKKPSFVNKPDNNNKNNNNNYEEENNSLTLAQKKDDNNNILNKNENEEIKVVKNAINNRFQCLKDFQLVSNKQNENEQILKSPKIKPFLLDIKNNIKSPSAKDSDSKNNIYLDCENSPFINLKDINDYNNNGNEGNIFIYNNKNIFLCEKIKSKVINKYCFINKINNYFIKIPKQNTCFITNSRENNSSLNSVKSELKSLQKKLPGLKYQPINIVYESRKIIKDRPKSNLCYFEKINKKKGIEEIPIILNEKTLKKSSDHKKENENDEVSGDYILFSSPKLINHKRIFEKNMTSNEGLNKAILTDRNKEKNNDDKKKTGIKYIKIDSFINKKKNKISILGNNGESNQENNRIPIKLNKKLNSDSGTENNIISFLSDNKLNPKKVLIDIYKKEIHNEKNSFNKTTDECSSNINTCFSWGENTNFSKFPSLNNNTINCNEINNLNIGRVLSKTNNPGKYYNQLGQKNETYYQVKTHIFELYNDGKDVSNKISNSKNIISEIKNDPHFITSNYDEDESKNEFPFIESNLCREKTFKKKKRNSENESEMLEKIENVRINYNNNKKLSPCFSLKTLKGENPEYIIKQYQNNNNCSNFEFERILKNEDIIHQNKPFDKIVSQDQKINNKESLTSSVCEFVDNLERRTNYEKNKFGRDNKILSTININDEKTFLCKTKQIINNIIHKEEEVNKKENEKKNKTTKLSHLNTEPSDFILDKNICRKSYNYENIKDIIQNDLDSIRNNNYKISVPNSQREKKYLDKYNHNNLSLNNLEINVNHSFIRKTKTTITEDKINTNKIKDDLFFTSYMNLDANDEVSREKKQEKPNNLRNNNPLNEGDEFLSFGCNKSLSTESLKDDDFSK